MMKKCKELLISNWLFLLADLILFVIMVLYGVHFCNIKGSDSIFSKTILSAIIFLVIMMQIAIVIAQRIRKSMSMTFFIVSFSFGIILSLLLPPYTIPDEKAHFCTAYEVSNRMLGIDIEKNGLWMREDDSLYEIKPYGNKAQDYELIYAKLNAKIQKEDLVFTTNQTVNTQHYQYYVPALGITIARILKMGTISMLYLGRIFNLLLYSVFFSLAIKICPVGKEIFFAVGLFPMALQQAASFSYDAFIMALATMIVALVLFLLDQPYGKKYNMTFGVLIFLCILFVPVKQYAYCFLSFFPILLIMREESNKKIKWIILVLFGVFLLMLCGDKVMAFLSSTHGSTSNVLEYCGEEAYTVSYLINNPGKLLSLIFNTAHVYGAWYLDTAIVDYLGWLEYPAQRATIYMTFLALMIATIQSDDEKKIFSRKQKICVGIIIIFSMCFIFAGMLLGWTPVSSNCVQGVQGRYFIPLFIPLLLMMKGNFIFKKSRLSTVPVWLMIIVDYISIQNVIFKL